MFDLTIAQARDALRARTLSAADLTEAYIGAVEALNPSLNAFITVTQDLARRQAAAADKALAAGEGGALTGIPLAVFYVLFGIPLSWLIDRSSRRNIVSASLIVWSAMTMLGSMSAKARLNSQPPWPMKPSIRLWVTLAI